MIDPKLTYLCEGEADTICALSHGLEAITVTGGAGSWRPEFSGYFKDRDVVIAYDADLTGYSGAQKVAKELAPVAARVRILIWPEQMLAEGPPGGDSPAQAKKRARAAANAHKEEISTGYVPMLPVKHGMDLSDYLVGLGHSVAQMEALLASAEEIPKPELQPSRFWGLNPGNNLVFKPALLAKDLVYEAFEAWCKKCGYTKPPTKPTFCRRMYELGEDIPDLKPGTKDTIEGQRLPSLRGIGQNSITYARARVNQYTSGVQKTF